MNATEITGIVSIVDTRTYEEIGDRWVAIPGSGTISQCARCGKDHEIHATVRLADGSTAVVGVSCAKGTAIEARVKSGASTAKTIARLRAELAAALDKKARSEAARAAVSAMEAPAPVWTKVEVYEGRISDRVSVGDAYADRWSDHQSDAGLLDYASDEWREKRLRELFGGRLPYNINWTIKDTLARIAKAEARLAA